MHEMVPFGRGSESLEEPGNPGNHRPFKIDGYIGCGMGSDQMIHQVKHGTRLFSRSIGYRIQVEDSSFPPADQCCGTKFIAGSIDGHCLSKTTVLHIGNQVFKPVKISASHGNGL